VIKSGRMIRRDMQHAWKIRERRRKIFLSKSKGMRPLGVLDVDVNTILKWIIKK
jgi:hypothetical protein